MNRECATTPYAAASGYPAVRPATGNAASCRPGLRQPIEPASFALACQLADFLLAQADLPDQTPDDAKYLETGWPVTSW